MTEIDMKQFEKVLNESLNRERIHAGWMAFVIRLLPSQDGFERLPSAIREEIEAIIAAID
jgi:hypothetical protein